MSKIFKVTLNVVDEVQAVELPYDAQILHVACQTFRQISLWYADDESASTTVRQYRVVGTGHEIGEQFKYIGTAMDGGFVWHVIQVF